MIQLSDKKTVIANGRILAAEQAQGIDLAKAADATLAARILKTHNHGGAERLSIKFDALCSHDITYVNIIQTARAAGLKEFPVPYVLTNCHNSLCAVGGTINEDDHVFGLMAAKKYGGIFVPPHLAVIHQFMREMMISCGSMVMGSDSHTRYGALGCMGVGEGGAELARQLLGETWNAPMPEIVAVWLEGSLKPGVGPQDVALAIIAAVFANGFVKNRVMEFMGPGIAGLSMDFRNGIDVMSTETACLSSIWQTDDVTRKWLALHGREKDYKELKLVEPALYDRLIKVDLAAIEPMIALPFHPANAYSIKEFNAHARELLAEVDARAAKLFPSAKMNLASKCSSGAVMADQGVIAGCAGGTFENISHASAILGDWTRQNPAFAFSFYPASVPIASALINNGATEKLMSLGAIVRTSFCGPCFGAGDTPSHNALSLRHTTRNFPNREGSKPGEGQAAAICLMDARSIAASAANGGRITSATDLDWNAGYLKPEPGYHFNPHVYTRRVYNGFGNPKPGTSLVFGPNIADWPVIESLPEHLILKVASVLLDPVTTTDELIPSGETSALRSNPQKLALHTLERRDPGYVERAQGMLALEKQRIAHPDDDKLLSEVKKIIGMCQIQPAASQMLELAHPLREIGLGSIIFAKKPGDGSAREQAASCQKVLGGFANMAEEYATKRYRSNLINWGLVPFIVGPGIGKDLQPGDYLLIPHIRSHVANGSPEALAALVHVNGEKTWSEQIALGMKDLTEEERKILLAGCMANYMARKNRYRCSD